MSTPLNTITAPPKRVLLVEDSRAAREEIINEAQQSFPGQFEFIEMQTQTEAQQWLKAERAAGRTVDLIMLDGTTEGRFDTNNELQLDALDFLAFLKAENILDIPVLGISGNDDSNRKIGKQCWQYGITVNARNKDGSEELGPSATYDLVGAGMKLIDKARAAQTSVGTPP
jgi:hypothetical protein